MSFPTVPEAKMIEEPYTLYHNLWSSCSLMVRFSIAASSDASSQATCRFVEREVDIQHGAQIDEYFMCSVNPKGQVPALTHPTQLSSPITDSLDITKYLYRFYPNLNPLEFAHDIETFLHRLHGISFFTLSFYGQPSRGQGLYELTKTKLTDPNISPAFRAALEVKLSFLSGAKEVAMLPETLKAEEAITVKLLEEIGAVRDCHPSSEYPWIFGTEFATALDAHLIIFLARLLDVERAYLMPKTIQTYAEAVMNLKLWTSFMQNRGTMYLY
ncbi:Fc.00g095690.m01.CDS01 [Cosmosporella sp. VM-42]